LRDFRARGFPAVPAVPDSLLDGKERVDGSSPSKNSRAPGYYGRSALLLVARVAAFAVIRGVTNIVLASACGRSSTARPGSVMAVL